MSSSWFGVFPYLPSPLTPDGEVDGQVMTRVVERCVDARVHGLTPLGSSGELPYLTSAQRIQVIDATVSAGDGRVPVVSGVGGFDTASVVRDAKRAQASGSDGVLLVPLAYFPLTDAEILTMIDAVTQAVGVPVVLYNHPHVTHVSLTTSLVSKAHYECGVDYVKDASGAIGNITAWRDATADRLRVFSATAVPPVAAMLVGACGWMSGPASVFPAASARIYELAARGEWQDAVKAQAELEPALDTFRRLGPGRAVKALLRAIGIDAGEPVAPLSGLTDEEIEQLAATLSSPSSVD